MTSGGSTGRCSHTCKHGDNLRVKAGVIGWSIAAKQGQVCDPTMEQGNRRDQILYGHVTHGSESSQFLGRKPRSFSKSHSQRNH